MTFDNISKEQVSPESFSYKSGLKLPVGQALGFDKKPKFKSKESDLYYLNWSW